MSEEGTRNKEEIMHKDVCRGRRATRSERLDSIVEMAINRVKENFTDHVFLEIQRDTSLFRSYLASYLAIVSSNVAKSGEKGYDTINSRIATEVERRTGARTDLENGIEHSPLSHLIQSFTRFNPASFLPLKEKSKKISGRVS